MDTLCDNFALSVPYSEQVRCRAWCCSLLSNHKLCRQKKRIDLIADIRALGFPYYDFHAYGDLVFDLRFLAMTSTGKISKKYPLVNALEYVCWSVCPVLKLHFKGTLYFNMNLGLKLSLDPP